MRLAIISDVQRNSTGLDAVLADVQARGGVDGFLVLGDLAALGPDPDPVGALERLAALPGARLVRGNTDRYLVTGERPPPTPAEVRADPGLLPQYTDVAQTLSWSQGCVAAAEWLDWLAALPGEVRLTLPDGSRFPGEAVLACARRELREEEAGLELEVRPTACGSADWALFLAEAPLGAAISLEHDREHDRYAWLPADEAVARCQPAQVAEALGRAVELLRAAGAGDTGPPEEEGT